MNTPRQALNLANATALNRSERAEVEKLLTYDGLGMKETVALGLSALIRACRTERSRLVLMDLAQSLGVLDHPEFVTGWPQSSAPVCKPSESRQGQS